MIYSLLKNVNNSFSVFVNSKFHTIQNSQITENKLKACELYLYCHLLVINLLSCMQYFCKNSLKTRHWVPAGM